jgi:catechol 2,3-dioxygenase-like lactoylglutathione lyase family enzyme
MKTRFFIFVGSLFIRFCVGLNPLGIERYAQVTMSVPNLNNTISWYENVLGFELYFYQSLPQYQTALAILNLNGTHLELIQDEQASGGYFRVDPPNHTRILGVTQFSFVVPDILATIEVLEKKNITTEFFFKNDVLQLYFVFIRDLNGNLIQFIQYF